MTKLRIRLTSAATGRRIFTGGSLNALRRAFPAYFDAVFYSVPPVIPGVLVKSWHANRAQTPEPWRRTDGDKHVKGWGYAP